MARQRVADAADVPPGQGRVVDVAGRSLALFNTGSGYYAMDNACVHRGGPLGEGDLDGTTVTCPWHGWRWSVVTGENANNPSVKAACYPVTLVEGQVWVDLP